MPDLIHHFHLSGKKMEHLAACYDYAYMVMQLPGGVLLDKLKLAIGTMKLISIWFPANNFPFVSDLMMTFGMLGAVAGQAWGLRHRFYQ